MLQCYFLAPVPALCQSSLTATELRQRGGTQGPEEAGADRDRSSDRDRNAKVSVKRSDRERFSERW